MLKLLTTYCLTFLASLAFAQTRDTSKVSGIVNTHCLKYSKEKALKDLQSEKPTVLLQGGIAPVVYTTDKDFEGKYSITFYDFGCVAADTEECLIAYNKTIFEYLDKTYGKKWRKEIRKDAIGLKN